MSRTLSRTPAVITVLAMLAAGCAAAGSPRHDRRVVVFAASSLSRAFGELGRRFAADNPGAEVEFSFAGSADLITQLTQGAAADVFAAADSATMNRVVRDGLVSGDPVDFASNRLTIAVAPGNPKGIGSLADLNRPGLAVVLCAPQVPCGAAATEVQRAAGVQLDPVSEESQVTDVLQKVISGQADAGLVYVTDVLAAGDRVGAVAIPDASAAANVYSIAVLGQSGAADLGRRFVDLVTGEAGGRILAAAGFGVP